MHKNHAYTEKPAALGTLSDNVVFSSLETGIEGFGFGDMLTRFILSCILLTFMGCIFNSYPLKYSVYLAFYYSITYI